jgi:hypothetical protein
MDRLLPWHISAGSKFSLLAWLVMTVGNALTLGAYAGAVTFAVKVVL